MATAIDFPPPRRDRRFLAMLVVSAALHGGVLAWVKGPPEERQAAVEMLTATLRMMAPQEPVAAPAVAEPPPRPAPPEMRKAPVAERHPVLASRAVSPQMPAAPAESVAPVPLPPPVAAATVAAAEPPPRPQPSQSNLLDAYSRHLADLFARQQDYPRIAAMRGWEGEVRVRLRVARKGNLLGINVDRSSGFEVLDQHAISVLERLPALPPLPDGIDGNEVQIVVPFHYKLKKPT